jgi:hypothetical protein
MSGRDFDAELRARVPELAVELLGKPTFRVGQEWRWGRKGSLSVVIGGARAGMWFDHVEGRGGCPPTRDVLQRGIPLRSKKNDCPDSRNRLYSTERSGMRGGGAWPRH